MMKEKISNGVITIGIFLIFVVTGASDGGYIEIGQIIYGISVSVFMIAAGAFIRKDKPKKRRKETIIAFQRV